MATFKGSSTEFKRFIGPYLRNAVNHISKGHKRKVGNCEHCGASGELHAAHVHGKDRIEIIESILRRLQPLNSQVIEVDLGEFEGEFKNEHSPVEKAILVLCNVCHRKYDSVPSDVVPKAKKPLAPELNRPLALRAELLPITLDPPRINDFVEEILRTKRAEIQSYFVDGRVKCQIWQVNKFSRASNLFRNLRSRPEFRQGEWQTRGIAKVHVRIVEP